VTAPQAHHLEDDLRLAGELVRDAGRRALAMRRGGAEQLGSEQKSGVADLVTRADREAEAAIVARLAVERPEDGVLGEEGAARDARSGSRTWVIDPVDGTYNFVLGLERWCSALALVEGEEPLLGAIHHPHADALYLGGPTLGATRNGEALAPIQDRPLSRACVATYLPPAAFTGPAGRAFAAAAGEAAAVRMLGSGSLDLAAIAEGAMHVYCQRRVPAWDRLPGEALVRGLGGAAVRVRAAGEEWTVIGVPTAVGELADRLAGFAWE